MASEGETKKILPPAGFLPRMAAVLGQATAGSQGERPFSAAIGRPLT